MILRFGVHALCAFCTPRVGAYIHASSQSSRQSDRGKERNRKRRRYGVQHSLLAGGGGGVVVETEVTAGWVSQ
jgi:hypothetical protein